MTDDEIFGTATIKKALEDKIPEAVEQEETTASIKSIEQKATDNKETVCNILDGSSDSENSDSNDQFKSPCSVKEMNGKKLHKFVENRTKSRPGLESVKAAINGEFVKRNSIFEEPSKSVPLPRKKGSISVTFSDRKFPTPARESSRVEEEEVSSLINFPSEHNIC